MTPEAAAATDSTEWPSTRGQRGESERPTLRSFSSDPADRFDHLLCGSDPADPIAQRLARAAAEARRTSGGDARASIAATIGAAVVVPWLLSILADATEHELEELVFVTRDGHLLRQVADCLIESLGLPISTELVHGSRQSWMLAAAASDPVPWLPLLLPPDRDVADLTIDAASARVGLDTPTNADPDQSGRMVMEALIRDLDRSGEWQSIQREEHERCQCYLEQQGIGRRERWGFVDLSTAASLHLALCSLLKTAGAHLPTRSYTWGLEANRPMDFDVHPTPYAFDLEQAAPDARLADIITFLEAVCSAPHGTTLGYETHDDGTVTPLLAPPTEGLEEWGRPTVEAAVLDTVRALDLTDVDWTGSPELTSVSLDAFREFWDHPTASEAEAWGSFPFEDGWGRDRTVLPLSPAVTAKRLAAVPIRGRLGFSHRHSWDAGSVAGANVFTRAFIRAFSR